MKWHKPTELPDGDMEVLAQYGNFTYANYVVLKYDNGFWWQHLPPMPPVIPDGGWFGIDESAILRWAYIKEAAEEDLLERLAKFYPELDYTFRSYMLQDFPELKEKIRDEVEKS